MQAYENLFNHFNVDVAQLLLTAEDLKLRRRNVQATVLRLFEHGGIIPIVNENDTVSVEELKLLGTTISCPCIWPAWWKPTLCLS